MKRVIAAVLLALCLCSQSSWAGLAKAKVSIGSGAVGQEARVPVFVTFPNVGTNETHVSFWQIVFDLGSAEFLSFEFPQNEPLAIVNPSPPCGGVLVQRPWPCSPQGLVGWLHVRGESPTEISVSGVELCGGQWYSQIVSEDSSCNSIGFYTLGSFEVEVGTLDSAVDALDQGPPTWTLVKALFR